MKLLWGIACILLWVSPALLSSQSVSPYRMMLQNPVDFSGWTGLHTQPEDLDEIRIGLYTPDSPDDPVGRSMVRGATLAVSEANKNGGFDGVPFRLVQRWATDPWGAGSKEVIRMIYEDSVWAVIGSLAGNATHVAEQIVTKARVPLLSPVSSDPTLTHTRIPWIFRLPPDDCSQTEVLVENGLIPMKLERIGVITSTDHDGRMAAFELHQALGKKKIYPIFHFEISPKEVDYCDIARRSAAYNPEGIVFRLKREQVVRMVESFQHENLKCPLIIPWIPGLKEDSLRRKYGGKIVSLQPFVTNKGASPDPCAAYSYDAVKIIIQGIRSSGLNRAKLRNAIADLEEFDGVTGRIEWDNGGGNLAQPVISTIWNTGAPTEP